VQNERSGSSPRSDRRLLRTEQDNLRTARDDEERDEDRSVEGIQRGSAWGIAGAGLRLRATPLFAGALDPHFFHASE